MAAVVRAIPAEEAICEELCGSLDKTMRHRACASLMPPACCATARSFECAERAEAKKRLACDSS